MSMLKAHQDVLHLSLACAGQCAGQAGQACRSVVFHTLPVHGPPL